MADINVDFEWKELGFVINALKSKIEQGDIQLKNKDLSDDEISDLNNDLMLFKSILQRLEEKRKSSEK